MYILIKADEPSNIKISKKGGKAHYFCADNLSQAKLYLKELRDADDHEYRSKYSVSRKSVCCREFNEYLKQIMLKPNTLFEKNCKILPRRPLVGFLMQEKKKRLLFLF